jgi:cytochrome c biogenesis protein CcmG, thiol:disulfide interchange protein DsbE
MSASASTPAAGRRGINKRVLVAGLACVVPLLAVLVLNLGRDPHAVRSPLVGRPAPPFAMVPVGGGAPVTLESLRGRPVVLNFWATWCVPCFQEHPVLNHTAAARRDVVFYGVVYQDEEQRIADFLQRQGSSYPTLVDPDSKAAIAYGIAGVPETYFIDAQGTIVEKWSGPLTQDMLDGFLRRIVR